MAKKRFLYMPVDLPADDANPEGTIVYRPTVMTKIYVSGSGPVIVACVLDTGADCCLLPSRVALSLGFDLVSLPRSIAKGIGNEAIEVFYAQVTIRIGDSFSFEARVGFSDGLQKVGVGVLGQAGFFDQFNVEFRLAEGFFTIEPAMKPAIQ